MGDKDIKLAKFRLNNVYVKSCNYSQEIPKKSSTAKPSFVIDIQPKGKVCSGSKEFQLELNVTIKEKKERFVGTFLVIGLFEFSFELNEESWATVGEYFYLNSSAILFPYVRAFIANMTAQSGIETVHIPTLNLTSLKERLKENILIE